MVTEDDHFNVGGDGEGGSGGGADHDPVQDMIACDRPIEFVPHSMSKYGMDAYRDPPVTGYQTLTTGTQVTGIGWKAMSTDETGMLRVQVNDSDADELNFQYQSGGTGVSADGDATSGYTLSLQAPPGNEDILLAVCNRDTTTGEASIAGGIGVAAYERFALELKVVPVGHELNYTQEQLEEALNDIYGQAVVSWDVEYLPALDINYWDENGDGLIERPNTDYSNEMRAVWESFLASMQYDPVQQGQAYLFVIPGITEGGDVRGYMPIKSRYGFVTADATTRDVAHELGHGVFNLRHTFSEENSFTLPQGETDNLMDYSTGTELWKYQWDFIHNPEGGWHIFEDVEEGESGVIVNKSKIMAVLDTLKNAYANGNSQVSYNYSTSILYHSSVALGDADPIQIQIEFYPRNQEVKINPGLYNEYPEENIYQQQGDFTSLRFEGIGTGGHDVLHIDVDSDNVDVLKNYLYGADLEHIQQFADSAMLIGESWETPGVEYTCNNTIRAYLYYMKNETVLFPVTDPENPDSRFGSGLETQDGPTAFKGLISWTGTANRIYEDLNSNSLTEYFERLTKPSTQTWNVFFDDIQNQANLGEIIIGVVKESGPGHIVAIVPKTLFSGTPEKTKVGDDFDVELPIAIEAGTDTKAIMQFPKSRSSKITRLTNPYIWFKYIK
ncbi:hypothetical protein [Salinivirga cyanobacteriivorans]|uniref:hypothetical protein n=1 Tax=Salinivirga cyanobacteriivorans TaxID=1307839 RepID=UPI000716E0D6|nr:hypothetical protein [Salinivirga cyanobacteriivorans]